MFQDVSLVASELARPQQHRVDNCTGLYKKQLLWPLMYVVLYEGCRAWKQGCSGCGCSLPSASFLAISEKANV